MRYMKFSCCGSLCLALALAVSGCGRVQLKASFSAFGEANPDRDSMVQDRFSEVSSTPKPGEAGNVRVLVNTIPEGLKLEGGVLSVEKGFQHMIVGKFSLQPDDSTWFKSYRTRWRKYYCYPQAPLTWVTLGLYGVLVPLYYPCFTTTLNDKSAVIHAAKQVASLSGGDLAIITYLGDSGPKEARGAMGFVLRIDPRLKQDGFRTTPQRMDRPTKTQSI